MADQSDVLVLGGGAVASVIALALRRRGASVVQLVPPEGSVGAGPIGVAWRGNPSPDLRGPTPRRMVIGRRFALLTSDAGLSVNFEDTTWSAGGSSPFVFEEDRWDAWAGDEAAKAGVEVRRDAPISSIVADPNGKVQGAEAGGRKVSARVTVVADPSVLPLGSRAGVRWAAEAGARPSGEVVVESTFSLPESRVSDRVGPGSGRAVLWEGVLGGLPGGALGFGYLLPGTASITAGTLLHAPSLSRAGTTAEACAKSFESHPAIRPFLQGAERTWSRTGTRPSPAALRRPLFGDGFLLAGEASGLFPCSGLIAPGADLWLASARMAAETVREALDAGDTTARVLSRYGDRLKRAGIEAELDGALGGGRRFKWSPRVHALYPALFSTFLRRMMTEKGQPKEHIRDLLQGALKDSRVPYTGAMMDVLGGLANL